MSSLHFPHATFRAAQEGLTKRAAFDMHTSQGKKKRNHSRKANNHTHIPTMLCTKRRPHVEGLGMKNIVWPEHLPAKNKSMPTTPTPVTTRASPWHRSVVPFATRHHTEWSQNVLFVALGHRKMVISQPTSKKAGFLSSFVLFPAVSATHSFPCLRADEASPRHRKTGMMTVQCSLLPRWIKPFGKATKRK